MKWIYIILLVAVVGGVLSNERLRGFIFSSSSNEQTSEKTSERPTSARLEEAGGISAMHGEVSR